LLVGNDIEETDKPIPFGQIIMISGEDLTQEDYLNLIRVQSRNGYIEGHMVKSTGNNIWLRISNSLGSKGFDLKFYGSMLIDLIKSQSPNVKNVQVIFITSAKDDLKLFHAVAEDAKETYQSIKEKKWSKKGVNIYDCAFHGNCASCSEKNVCSEINKIAENKKKTG
jgi:CO dehydrogenase/acetyl-CoA synthase beta subunit